jgi:hypothetical protein
MRSSLGTNGSWAGKVRRGSEASLSARGAWGLQRRHDRGGDSSESVETSSSPHGWKSLLRLVCGAHLRKQAVDGPTKSTTAYRSFLWADAELLGIAVDYENLSLVLRESTGRLCRAVCEGYIGYEAIGMWDEIVVTEARLNVEGPFLARCCEDLERRLGASRHTSGSEPRNRAAAMELIVVLSDGCEVRVAMKGLRFDQD